MPSTTLSVVFSDDCWRFLSSRLDADPAAIGRELRIALQRPPRLHVVPPEATPRYVVDLHSTQVYELLNFLTGIHDALSKDDERRDIAERCLRAIGAAITRHRAGPRRG